MTPIIGYGLIGKKLGHSFSARYFNEKFAREHIPAHYSLYEMETADSMLPLIKNHPELRGLNVTIPFKQDVIPMLDELSPTARGVGAVNTIRIERISTPLPSDPNLTSTTSSDPMQHEQIRLVGHNTDACGFRDAIKPLLNGRRHALVLGLGGASKAVIYALGELGISVTKVSRTAAPGVLTYEDLTENVIANHDIIINCTPLGMWPATEACPDIPYEYLSSRYLCFDLIYNPEETEFMRRAKKQGAEVSNGLQMLYNQADAAYDFWNTRTFYANSTQFSSVENQPSEPSSSSTILTKKSFMSRKITIIDDNGDAHIYFLSIAEVAFDSEGRVIEVRIKPFQREICNVTYIDSPITIQLMNKMVF